MIRPSTDRRLPVALYETPAGELADTPDGPVLLWSDEAIDRWGLNSPALSRSLRVGELDAEKTASFFGALLPEGKHLDRLASEAKVASNDLLGIFSHVGSDLAGALRVGAAAAATEPERLTPEQVGVLLESASGFLVGGGGSALPGFQRKLTLTRVDGAWLRGNGTVASTHILKPVETADRPAVESEAYTLAIARRLGLTDFDSWVEEISARAVLILERYDRRIRPGAVDRIHQEDAGQALGLGWGGGDKFEINEPRASLKAVSTLLDLGRTVFAPGRPDTEKLLRYTTLNIAAGNTDAHAKNFSLLHAPNGTTNLAPFYDAAPLALAYGAPQTLSMRVNGQWFQPETTRDDLIAEGVAWGLDQSRVAGIVDETLELIVEATRSEPAHPSIAAHVPGYIRGQAQNLLAGRRARIDSPIPLMLQERLGTPLPGHDDSPSDIGVARVRSDPAGGARP